MDCELLQDLSSCHPPLPSLPLYPSPPPTAGFSLQIPSTTSSRERVSMPSTSPRALLTLAIVSGKEIPSHAIWHGLVEFS
ncbi:hypothetical protein INR49_018675 [Caranx melampygus]|nr:hypothetical protein INR49_018675 [Caranx melampygus]